MDEICASVILSGKPTGKTLIPEKWDGVAAARVAEVLEAALVVGIVLAVIFAIVVLVFNIQKWVIIAATSILGDLKIIRLDRSWNYVGSRTLRRHAWCPEGFVSHERFESITNKG